ncbi:MAG TPA: glycosyltransferase family 39 protein [Candidatus Elarobacter sp.]|jgi:4-amino-4-deoxy-L-arabinose transferase-like glycosyltransferase|nr:glycosyltransferase family 39 protein [Candidatus Elarobacter sp.]
MRSVPARAALLGAIFAALVTLPGLGIGTLWDNSETAYGEVAREVVLSHDWVVMHLNGQPWFVQPPLYFWIAAVFAKLFGISTLALRLPSALATIAMGGAVGYATARIAGERAGMIAAIVLSTSLMQAIVGRLAIMDALLDFAIAAAVLWWYRAFEPSGSPRRRDTAFVCGALALAIGTLAKGPVAPVITALVVGVWTLWERRAGRLAAPRRRAVALAALVFLAVTLPWFVALAVRVGPGAIGELIGHYTFGRYTGVIENQNGPFWYYIPVIILGFFPWIAFVPVAAIAAWREARNPDGAFARLALVWTIVPFLFFTFASTKLPNYIAMVLPALAILVALWFERVRAGADRRAAVISALTIPVFVGIVAFAIGAFSRSNRLDVDLAVVNHQLVFLGVAMLFGSLLTVVAIARRTSAAWSPYVLALTSGALVLFIALIAEPAAEPLKPIPPIARTIDASRKPGDTIAIGGVSGGNGLIFYTVPPVRDIKNNAGFVATVCENPEAWVVTRPQDAQRLAGLARSLHRTAEVVMQTPSPQHPRAALIHVAGPTCPRD